MKAFETLNPRKLAIHFTNLRPYHLARLRSAEDAFEGSGMEVHGFSLFSATGELPDDLPISRPARSPKLLFEASDDSLPNSTAVRMRTLDYLDKLQPDAVAICGYATPDARACLRWCRRHRASAILMTETREQDGARVWWKEWIKARIVRSFDGALCGGSDARNYLEKLGMPAVRIAEGYDVVDNDYFATEAQKHRSTDPPVALYFLASGRFIERKNYGFLIEAYAAYVKRACSPTIDNRQPATATWNLCLLGDGEQKTDLIAHCHRLGLNVIEAAPWESNEAPSTKNQERNTVFFPGWRSHAELPRFYAHAGAFVHPAVSEPWGLVVNEAMASELPLLVSPGTGAVKSFFKEDCDQNLFSQDAQIASEQMLEISDAQHKPAEFDEAPWQTKLSENAHQSAFGRVLAELLLLLY